MGRLSHLIPNDNSPDVGRVNSNVSVLIGMMQEAIDTLKEKSSESTVSGSFSTMMSRIDSASQQLGAVSASDSRKMQSMMKKMEQTLSNLNANTALSLRSEISEINKTLALVNQSLDSLPAKVPVTDPVDLSMMEGIQTKMMEQMADRRSSEWTFDIERDVNNLITRVTATENG